MYKNVIAWLQLHNVANNKDSLIGDCLETCGVATQCETIKLLKI